MRKHPFPAQQDDGRQPFWPWLPLPQPVPVRIPTRRGLSLENVSWA